VFVLAHMGVFLTRCLGSIKQDNIINIPKRNHMRIVAAALTPLPLLLWLGGGDVLKRGKVNCAVKVRV
jgi:hypothetical protein